MYPKMVQMKMTSCPKYSSIDGTKKVMSLGMRRHKNKIIFKKCFSCAKVLMPKIKPVHFCTIVLTHRITLTNYLHCTVNVTEFKKQKT